MQSRIKVESSARPASVAASLPLSTLLSQALVAFTIEFDNEAERQMPHRTTRHGSTAGSTHAPWLVSLVMWTNCMQFVGEEGVTVRKLEELARTNTNLNGMQPWGYIRVAPDPADKRPKPPRSDWVIRATTAGRKAQEVWRPLFGVIEKRWQERFGKHAIEQLRKSLSDIILQFDLELPDCLPILGYGLFSKGHNYKRRAPGSREDTDSSTLPLSALLSPVLLAFALDFESESDLSLAISANILRVLDEKGVRVRDLPLLSGVSKEAISIAMGFLQKRRIAVIEPDPAGSRAKIARLTPKGREAQDSYQNLLGVIEDRWHARFGKDIIRALRESLEQLVGEPTSASSPLFRGLEPYPDGWRASVPKPDTLPHYPVVTHRGGFPDGS
jgi:DNA-binding MarR family transcriptional regulator